MHHSPSWRDGRKQLQLQWRQLGPNFADLLLVGYGLGTWPDGGVVLTDKIIDSLLCDVLPLDWP